MRYENTSSRRDVVTSTLNIFRRAANIPSMLYSGKAACNFTLEEAFKLLHLFRVLTYDYVLDFQIKVK